MTNLCEGDRSLGGKKQINKSRRGCAIGCVSAGLVISLGVLLFQSLRPSQSDTLSQMGRGATTVTAKYIQDTLGDTSVSSYSSDGVVEQVDSIRPTLPYNPIH